MTRLIITIFLYCLAYYTHAQTKYATTSKKAIAYYELALSAIKLRDYNATQENLEKALNKDPKFIDAYLLRAELWRMSEKPDRQITDLKIAINIDPQYFPYAYFNLGSAQLVNGQYIDSEESFNLFLAMPNVRETSKQKAQKGIEQCQFAQTLVDNPVPFKLSSLGDSINNNYDQYWPSLSINGKFLYYSVLLVDSLQKTFYGEFAHQEDFFVSQFKNGYWSKGTAIGKPLNTPGNEGALKISADGNTLVFTACNREDGHGQCDIYFAYQATSGWTRPNNIRTPVNTKYSEKQPCLSADSRTLYFSSNRPGGLGGMDIWYSELDFQGFWSNPINMGPTINTEKDEESPLIHLDNKTFYFSSDGHLGLGMKDIFVSRRTDSTDWSTPQNIGYPVNTNHDEIGLFVDNTGEKAYYSTNFADSSRNIYSFTMPENMRPHPVSYLTGKITDIETQLPLKANIELLEANTGTTVMKVESTKEDGTYLICLPGGTKYALNVSCENYLFKSVHFNLSALHPFDQPFEQNIELSPIKLNEAIVLNNIFFESDSYILSTESNAELFKIEQFIRQNPGWIFEIGGHTDQTGSQEYNLKLSENRAKTVYEYLISKEIDNEKLRYKGYGETKPINTENSDHQKAKNRRTELKIVKSIN